MLSASALGSMPLMNEPSRQAVRRPRGWMGNARSNRPVASVTAWTGSPWKRTRTPSAGPDSSTINPWARGGRPATGARRSPARTSNRVARMSRGGRRPPYMSALALLGPPLAPLLHGRLAVAVLGGGGRAEVGAVVEFDQGLVGGVADAGLVVHEQVDQVAAAGDQVAAPRRGRRRDPHLDAVVLEAGLDDVRTLQVQVGGQGVAGGLLHLGLVQRPGDGPEGVEGLLALALAEFAQGALQPRAALAAGQRRQLGVAHRAERPDGRLAGVGGGCA